MEEKIGMDEITMPMISQPTRVEEGAKRSQYIAALAATLGALIAGTILSWTAPVLPQLQEPNSTLPVTTEEGSWIGSLVAVGAFIGAFPAGYCADYFGRRITIASLSGPFLLSWLLIIFASNVWMLYVARFIAGMATGAISVTAPMYIGEIAESSVRGALGSFFQLMLTVGILLVYTIGSFVSYTVLSIICGIIPVVFLIVFLFMPETPIYLLKKNERAKAEKSLQFLRGPNYNITHELYILQADLDEMARNKATIKDLISSPGTRRALLISLGLMTFQQLSGINAVIFYATIIFESAGSTLDPNIATIIVGVVQVVVTYAATLLVDRAGRRILLLISSSVMGVCLAVLGIYFYLQHIESNVENIGWLPLMSVVIFIVVFSLGFGPIPWMMMGELFPSNVKGVASALAVSLNWILTFVVTKSFQGLLESLGSHFTFWMFACICVVATCFIIFLVPETKGKTLQEIQDILGGKKNATTH